ncbi:MAG: hypothetical protein JST54_20410 [Deltaproteobacteria bacterium]|nr:hypothetical protein [Deltaproteobacteria bacterium]
MIRLRSLAAIALLPLVACSSRVVSIGVTVLTKRCTPTGSTAVTATASDGVDHYKVVISGADFDPITKIAAPGAIELDAIPPGSNRVLAITGYKGDPSGTSATPLAFGQSVPFTVPTDPSQKVQVTVLLKPAGEFIGVSTTADATKCATLTTPRAGHTATLLNDGRVLFTGGFSLKPNTSTSYPVASDSTNWVFRNDAEIFDPATNTSTAVSAMTYVDTDGGVHDDDTAFQAAALLQDGTVFVSGGEVGSGANPQARPNTMLYSPGGDSWQAGYMSYSYVDGGSSGAISRSRHTSAADSSGRAIVVGGIDYQDLGGGFRQAVLADDPIWLDPATGQFHGITDIYGAPVDIYRENARSAAVLGNSALAVVGGDVLDAGLADPPIIFFQYSNISDSNGNPTSVMNMLAQPLYEADAGMGLYRSHAAAAVLGAEQHLMVIAGGTGPDGGLMQTAAVVDSTVSSTQLPLATPGRGRNDPCAAALADGRVLVAGGQTSATQTSNLADLYSESSYTYNAPTRTTGPSSSAQAKVETDLPSMLQGRFLHTCTVLNDGSVLIAGGVNEDSGKFTVLNTLELYVPVPVK